MNLKLTLIQSDLHWEDVDANLSRFEERIASISEPTDIIILPEMFNTGFSMESEKLAETMGGKSVTWLKTQAKKMQAVIVASLIIKEKNPLSGGARGGFYNRLIWADPDGTITHYDKRHLFRMAGEHEHFDAGQERLIVEYKGWRICPLICYDLRFPVWSRNQSLTVDRDHPSTPLRMTEGKTSAYDLLIYIANWPAARKAPWSKLLEARAIENQCYVVGLNRVGQDGKQIEYSGNSAVIDPKGEIISSIPESANHLQTISISLGELNDFREKFPVGMDADEFGLI
ncbi:MAG: nitrilase family protein [Flavobacteriales bacterium]|nr:nitrilase family protein [Flavobacteriales bacterium]